MNGSIPNTDLQPTIGIYVKETSPVYDQQVKVDVNGQHPSQVSSDINRNDRTSDASKPEDNMLKYSPRSDVSSESASSSLSTPSLLALEKSISDAPGVTTSRLEFDDTNLTKSTASTSASRSTGNPTLERAYTSGELLSIRAKEFQISREGFESDQGNRITTSVITRKGGSSQVGSGSFSLTNGSGRSITTTSPEVESVTLPPSGITTVEMEKTMHTVFAVNVKLHGGLQWIIKKRYSDFRELHEQLKRITESVRLLNFPKRHMFRNRNHSVIEQRRLDLQKYINDVLDIRQEVRVPLNKFLEVYAHLDSYERKLKRKRQELESERMKNLLSPGLLIDYSAAFRRLCSSKFSYVKGNVQNSAIGAVKESTNDVKACTSIHNETKNSISDQSEVLSAANDGIDVTPTIQSPANANSPAVANSSSSPLTSTRLDIEIHHTSATFNSIMLQSGDVCISRASFRRDILGTFPDMPSSFATRFMKAVSDRRENDISMNEFLRAIAILKYGELEDRLTFVFNMCDLDHADKVQSTGVSNFLISLHGRTVLDRSEFRAIMSDGFDQGRTRLTLDQFLQVIPNINGSELLVDWMEPFIDTICETADPKLLESQEEFNPAVQQKILARETHFSVKEISQLQDVFHTYIPNSFAGAGAPAEGTGEDSLDMESLTNDFPLEMSDSKIRQIFSSFGSRANGKDVDIFSFVHALAIACRGSEEEKIGFMYTLFASTVVSGEQTPIMSRDDLCAMLHLDLPQNPALESKVSNFMESFYVSHPLSLPPPMRLSSSSSTLSLGGDISMLSHTPMSKSNLSRYVDATINEFAVRHTKVSTQKDILAMNIDEFTRWCLSQEYESGILRILRETVYINLGLIPMKAEEVAVAKGCYKAYDPETLVEDERWYLIEYRWFEHWCKYVNLPFVESVAAEIEKSKQAALNNHTSTASSTLIELQSKLTNAPVRKDVAITDADGHYLRPKGITNYSLLQGDRRDNILRSSDEIQLHKHFVVVTEQMWLGLKLWYGGGPEIARTVVRSASSGVPFLDIWETSLKRADQGEGSTASDEVPDEKSDHVTRRIRAGGAAGLSNLGNTCYMNSALQCISNTEILAEYFLSGMYLDDINRTSTLGLQGKLAEVYGKLAEEMWCSKSKSIKPYNFKKTIGKFNEAFRGNMQQDAQELLAFLLSGLSEDLNRIQDKPYIEQPDSDGRYDGDLADEWWRNHLRREVSIIVALFTGQYRSVLTCGVCQFKSARFEPFTFLQVPLPEPTHHTVSILLVLSSGANPTRVSVRLEINANVYDLKKSIVEMCHDDLGHPEVSIADIKICEYSGPMLLSYKGDSRRVRDIRSVDRLVAYQLEPLSPELLQATRQRESYYPLEPVEKDDTITDEETEDEELAFIESLSEGLQVEVRTTNYAHDYEPAIIVEGITTELAQSNSIVPAHKMNKKDLKQTCILVSLCRSNNTEMVPLSRVRPRQARLLYVSLLSRKLSYSAVYFKNPFRPVPFGIPNLVRICPEHMTGLELYQLVWNRVHQFVEGASPPTCWPDSDKEIIRHSGHSTRINDVFSQLNSRCGFLLRRVEHKGITDSRSSWITRSFGFTIPCTNDVGIDLMDDESIAIDWDLTVFSDRVDLDAMKTIDVHSSLSKNEALDNGPVPLYRCLEAFTTEEVISEGYCSSCCKHQEVTKKLEVWRLPPVMVIQLKRFQSTQSYQRKLGTLVEFPIEGLDLSCCVAPHEEFPTKYAHKNDKRRLQPSQKTLNEVSQTKSRQVVDELERVEEAGSTVDEANSNNATSPENSSKNYPPSNLSSSKERNSDTSQLDDQANNGPIQGNGILRKENSTTSDSKLEIHTRMRRGYTNTNLDQSRCMETKYDLYAVVNHTGALNGGHYTAYARNAIDEQWYHYDDERVRVIEESKVVSNSAYLLFYLRSDMKGVNVKDMFPQKKKGGITDEDIHQFVENGDQRRCQIM